MTGDADRSISLAGDAAGEGVQFAAETVQLRTENIYDGDHGYGSEPSRGDIRRVVDAEVYTGKTYSK